MRLAVLLTLLLASLLPLGCSTIDSEESSILGFMTYRRVEGSPSVLVRNGFVALYRDAEPDTIIDVFPTDSLGRFNIFIPHGRYRIAGSTREEGPFSGRTEGFLLEKGKTARFQLAIDEDPPS